MKDDNAWLEAQYAAYVKNFANVAQQLTQVIPLLTLDDFKSAVRDYTYPGFHGQHVLHREFMAEP